jgi:7-cyano-7-deazaguanine synthase
MKKLKSILLLSGGFDSAVNLALCRELDLPVLALTVDYGQKASTREIEAARSLCQYYEVEHQVLPMQWLARISASSLNQASQIVPQLKMSELDNLQQTVQSARSVWVPNRNGLFIHAAGAFADAMGAEQVVVGFNAEEALTFGDNSLEYLERESAALKLSTSNAARVHSYTVNWSKRRIFIEAQNLSKRFPLELVWSCYLGEQEPCQNCESCQRFARATTFVPPVREARESKEPRKDEVVPRQISIAT